MTDVLEKTMYRDDLVIAAEDGEELQGALEEQINVIAVNMG